MIFRKFEIVPLLRHCAPLPPPMLHMDSHFEKYMMRKEKHSYSIALLFSYL